MKSKILQYLSSFWLSHITNKANVINVTEQSQRPNQSVSVPVSVAEEHAVLEDPG